MLPFSKAFEIAWKGIRIRIWRSLITMSGIVLAIAFLMSVWSSSVITSAMRSVSADHELYPLVRGVMEAEAIGGGGVLIRCAIMEEPAGASASEYLGSASSIRRLLASEPAFRADLVPADAQAVVDLLDPKQPTRPDVLILVGLPAALTESNAAGAVEGFVRQGGFLLVYGAAGEAGVLEDILPATQSGEPFTTGGDDIVQGEHLAASGVPWRRHPEAQFIGTEGKPGAVSLAASSGRAVAWLWDVGQGSVAWYPITEQWAATNDVVSWFLRGQILQAAEAGDPRTSLLVKLIAHGCMEKLEAEEHDVRGLWLVSLSLMVCVVGITNAMLMSVTERFREIGTMKCLGALDKFVVKLFLIESSLQGVVGSLIGALIGFLLAFLRALFVFHVRDLETGEGHWLVLQFLPVASLFGWLLVALGVGIVLSVVAAVYPAMRAARMEPVQAMRVEA